MIDFIRSWVISIAMVIIFVSFLEILLPTSSMKRFVKVIIGLLIIYTIVKPFILLKDIDINLKKDFIETSGYLEKSYIEENGQNILDLQSKQTIEIFKNSLEDRIIYTVSDSYNIDSESIKIETKINEDINSKDFGKIQSLQISIQKTLENTVVVNKIDKIDISKDKDVMKKDKIEYNFNDNKLTERIKKDLSEKLQIDQEKIIIFYTEKN